MGLLAPLFLCRESPSHSQSMPKYFKILTTNICIFAGCDCECDFQPAQRVVNVFQNVPVSVFSLQSQGAKCYPDIEKKKCFLLNQFYPHFNIFKAISIWELFHCFLRTRTTHNFIFGFSLYHFIFFQISDFFPLCQNTHYLLFCEKRIPGPLNMLVISC